MCEQVPMVNHNIYLIHSDRMPRAKITRKRNPPRDPTIKSIVLKSLSLGSIIKEPFNKKKHCMLALRFLMVALHIQLAVAQFVAGDLLQASVTVWGALSSTCQGAKYPARYPFLRLLNTYNPTGFAAARRLPPKSTAVH